MNASYDSSSNIDFCGKDWHHSEHEHIVDSFMKYCDGWLVLLVGFPGIVANIICLAVLARRRLRGDLFHRLLFAFAVSDIMVIILCGGKYCFRAFNLDNYVYTILYPYVIHPGHKIAISGSVFMTLAVSVERFLAICYGFQLPPYTRKSRYYILVVALTSITINIPRFMESKIDWPIWKKNGTVPRYTTSDLRRNEVYVTYYYTIFSGLVTGFIPVILLFILNFKAAFEMFQQSKRINLAPNLKESANKHQKKTFIMALAIVITFLFFTIPRVIVDFWELFHIQVQRHCEYELEERFNPSIWIQCLVHVSHFCTVFNSSINFAIYCFFGTTFRQEFIAMIKPILKCVRRPQLSQTHNDTEMELLRDANWRSSRSVSKESNQFTMQTSLHTTCSTSLE